MQRDRADGFGQEELRNISAYYLTNVSALPVNGTIFFDGVYTRPGSDSSPWRRWILTRQSGNKGK